MEEKHICLSTLIHRCGDRKPTLRPFGGGGWVATYTFPTPIKNGWSSTEDVKWFECHGFSPEDAVSNLIEELMKYDAGLAEPSNDFWPRGIKSKS